ncbi:MAG: glycosyltransferase family 1 protein [Anaerolineales bacterium]|nr:MAG: glycosyltransferase family 1 protein [Anaerolineales bacterium]
MINVLHLVASSHGGAATHVRDLALGLPRQRFRTTVAMTLDGGNVSSSDFTTAKTTFEPVNIASGLVWHEVLHLRRLLQAGNFHLVHLHGARAAFYGRLAVATLRPRPRAVFSIHGFAIPFYPLLKRVAYLWLERALQQVTDCTICVAQAEASLFLSFGLTTQEQTRVVPYGIDVARFATPLADITRLREDLGVGQGLVVLTVCRLNVPRDFASLLTAFCKVRGGFPTAHLLIVGDGPQRAEVEAFIHRLGLTHCAHITGFRNDVPALMALADVYVLTSYGWEGYPISTLEAQAAGVPIVVTDAGGSREAVQHEKTGLVVPKRHPDLLAEALLRLLRDPDLRQRMGEAGQQRAHREFTRERMIGAMTDVYCELLSAAYSGTP